MMSNRNILQSERQRPRAVELMKAIYESHTHDPNCGLGEACPQMVDLKKRIEEYESNLAGDSLTRPLGLK
jgi:hypothetical protein